MDSDDKAGYLRTEPSALWQKRLKDFDNDAARIAAQARAANVPLVAVLIPNHAQAAMISLGEWPDGYDPYKLDRELDSIITSHGETYIELLPVVRSAPDLQQDFYPVDGHPDANGHAVLSALLAKELTNGAVPALKAPVQQPITPEQGK